MTILQTQNEIRAAQLDQVAELRRLGSERLHSIAAREKELPTARFCSDPDCNFAAGTADNCPRCNAPTFDRDHSVSALADTMSGLVAQLCFLEVTLKIPSLPLDGPSIACSDVILTKSQALKHAAAKAAQVAGSIHPDPTPVDITADGQTDDPNDTVNITVVIDGSQQIFSSASRARRWLRRQGLTVNDFKKNGTTWTR